MINYEAARKRKKKAKEKAKRIGTYKVKPAIKICDDGREVCNLKTAAGKAEYLSRIEQMAERQHWVCGCGCGNGMYVTKNSENGIFQRYSIATFDHQDGRGANGAHRDDRILRPDSDGKLIPYNRALTLNCNIRKGSKRGYDTTVTRHSEHIL